MNTTFDDRTYLDELKTKIRWNHIYKERKILLIDENVPKIAELFQEHKMKRVLDLGCGSGRHTVYLAQRGFHVYGIDLSEEGVKRAAHLLDRKNLRAFLTVGSFANLPYKRNSFDSCVSIRVLHHARIEAIRKAIDEIKRVVIPKGLIFVTVRKKVPKGEWRPSKEIAPHTYIPLEGVEKGTVHYLFTKDVLEKEFNSFKICDIWVDNRYYCLLGENK